MGDRLQDSKKKINSTVEIALKGRKDSPTENVCKLKCI